ncbi:cysteine--tRNA ligase [Parapedomonas caeni]
MSLHLYNTLTRAKDAFIPADPRRVTMYVCGPTVYTRAHIGNARPPVVFDVLFRLLRRTYGADQVVYARNITDVEDKINKAAEALDPALPINDRIKAVTGKYEAFYLDDMAALGVLPPTIDPHATDHIAQMITLIERLIAHGNAYAADGHVLFNVPSFDGYGALSRRNRDDMIAGARVEVAPYKRDPADFVLWKPSTADQPGWDSPWGRGRPGWHIECSAMIEAHLGRSIDIHGGGQDLIFPHHENEIAQSVCANHAPLARYWLHNGFLSIDAEKMSKSLGNVLLVSEILAAGVKGETVRLALLSAHYRQPLDWNDQLVEQSKRTLDRLYGLLRGQDVTAAAEAPAAVVEALEDDLNTPLALAALARLADARDLAGLKAGATLLGLLQQDPDAWFQGGTGDSDLDADAIEARIAARAAAKQARDFKTADAIRDELKAAGVVLEDGPAGTVWRRA